MKSIEKLIGQINGDKPICIMPYEATEVHTPPRDLRKIKSESSFCRICENKFRERPCKLCREINPAMPVNYYKEVEL